VEHILFLKLELACKCAIAIDVDKILRQNLAIKQSSLGLDEQQEALAFSWNHVRRKRTNKDVFESFESDVLEFVKPVFEELKLGFDFDRSRIFEDLDERAVAYLLERVQLGEMELVLEIVLLPDEVLALALV